MQLIHSAPVAAFLLTLSAASLAHNNPGFREDFLFTLEVSAEANAEGQFSKPFSIEWPAKTVQLVWHIDNQDGKAVSFSVTQDGKEVLSKVADGDKTTRLKGTGFAITQVSGSDGSFQVQVHARVLDRSIKK